MKKTNIFALLIVVAMLFTAAACTLTNDKPQFQGVVNGQLPELTIEVKQEVDLLEGVEAIDNTATKVVIVVDDSKLDNTKIGSYTITYTASDESGNIESIERVVHVIDKIAPIFQYVVNGALPEASHLQYKSFDLLKGDELATRDNYDSALTVSVIDEGGYDVEVAGKYTLTYEVKDSSGNANTATRVVTVEPAIKVVSDVLKINEETYIVQYNNDTALSNPSGSGMELRNRDAIQMMTKEFFVEKMNEFASQYANNGNVPYLPYGVAVILDSEMKPVDVRNATYALEVIKTEGVWKLLKNGTIILPDLTEEKITVNFIDGLSTNGGGILGGNIVDYVPEGGFVLLTGSPFGGAKDTNKIFLVKNLLAPTFGGGAVDWAMIENSAISLCEAAQFEYIKDSTMIYPKPADLAAPVLKMEKHVLSWDAISGTKEYEIYVDGVKVSTTTKTTVAMASLGLEPSLPEASYKIQVKAISPNIVVNGHSALSEELAYVMPNATTLDTPVVTLTEGVINWEAVTGAVSYEIYAKQVGEAILLANVTELSYNLKENSALAKLIYTANIMVKAIGDGAEYLDSSLSTAVVHLCSEEKVISFGTADKFPVIETTAADYFARRNDATAVGYASKNFFFYINNAADAYNIDLVAATNCNEAGGFVVLLDKDNVVKAIVSTLATLGIYHNYEWKTCAEVGYTSNSKQIENLRTIVAEGDKFIIGRNVGALQLGEITGLGFRDVLANYYWKPVAADAKQSWRAEHTITTYPEVTIKLANAKQLENPTLSVEGSVVSWAAVENAESYDLYVGGELKKNLTETSFDLKDYIESIGRSGSATTASNASDLTIKLVAKAKDKDSSTGVEQTYTISATVSDGTNAVNVSYNLANSFWNGGSGANFRLNDVNSTVMNGSCYKKGITDYASGHANNGGVVYMNNGIIVVFDKDMNVKFIRFCYVNQMKITSENAYVKEGLTWTNGIGNATTAGGNLAGLSDEIEDTDYVLIGTNVGSKAQITAIVSMFIDTDAAAVVGKTLIPSAESTTKVVLANADYSLVFKAVAK